MIAGPSGVGKGTLIRRVRELRPELGLSVSWTTRPPRPAERDGADYRFVSPSRFQTAVDADEFVEWEEYRGAWYGTPWTEVRRALEEGRSIVLEIDVRGAKSIKTRFPEAITVFVAPPSIEALEARLRGRGTDPEERIAARLAAAREEMRAQPEFDHSVVNDDVETAAREIIRIIDMSSPLWTSEDSR